jgi:hypothetical protein
MFTYAPPAENGCSASQYAFDQRSATPERHSLHAVEEQVRL